MPEIWKAGGIKMDWFKVYSEGILRGSLADADDTTQLIWVKLLGMANETRSRDGHLWFAPGHPYELEFIAQSCHTTLDQLRQAIDVFVNEIYTDGNPRLIIEADGTLFLKNWAKYQGSPSVKAKTSQIPLSLEDANASQQAAAARLAYLQPDAAQRGVNARIIEENIKQGEKE